MGAKFNPLLDLGIDIVGTSGAPTVQTPNYVHSFNNTTDWGSPSGGLYTLTLAFGTHGKGANPIVQVLMDNGTNFESILIPFELTVQGSVVLQVSETPDNRFTGKLLISENN